MQAELTFGLDRVGAACAVLKPDLLGEEDPVCQVRAVAEFEAAALAAVFLPDIGDIAEGVEFPPLALAGIAKAGARLEARAAQVVKLNSVLVCRAPASAPRVQLSAVSSWRRSVRR